MDVTDNDAPDPECMLLISLVSGDRMFKLDPPT